MNLQTIFDCVYITLAFFIRLLWNFCPTQIFLGFSVCVHVIFHVYCVCECVMIINSRI